MSKIIGVIIVQMLTQIIKSESPFFCPPPGSFYNYYQHYDFTYITCGIVLIIGSIFLFVGMGINYHMLDREKKAEEQKEREEPKEVRAAMLPPSSPAKSSEDGVPAAVTMDEVSRMDEDTV